MFDILLVGCGGFVGASLRYIVMMAINSATTGIFPWATFIINVIGCFVIGFFSIILPLYYPAEKAPLLFFSTGMVGGFTTLAAFGIETIGLMEQNNILMAGGYITVTLLACLLGVFLGRMAGRALYGVA